jgi:hypothetical protein
MASNGITCTPVLHEYSSTSSKVVKGTHRERGDFMSRYYFLKNWKRLKEVSLHECPSLNPFYSSQNVSVEGLVYDTYSMADNLAAIYEPNVWKLWEPQPLATLRASTACTGTALPYILHEIHFLNTSKYLPLVIEWKPSLLLIRMEFGLRYIL